MKQKIILAVLSTAILLFASCKQEILVPDISGMETTEYVLNIGDKLVLAPNITNLKGNTYVWLLDGKEVANGATDYTFVANKSGNYVVIFKAVNKGGTGEKAFKILVEKEISIAFEKEKFEVAKCKVLEIKPNITGPERKDYEYQWAIGDSIIGKDAVLDFISLAADTTYLLTIKASAGKQSATATCKVKVEDAKYRRLPFALFDFRSAPENDWASVGTYIGTSENVAMLYPYTEFLQKASEFLQKNAATAALSSWGSYVVFGFDHSIVNIPSKRDLKLIFEASILGIRYSPIPISTIYVAQDKNRNGIPDDEWFEIKTTDYGKETVKDYERTYTLLETSVKDWGNGTSDITTKYEWKDNQKGKEQNGNSESQPKTVIRSKTVTNSSKTISFFPGYYFDNGEIKQLAGWEKSFTFKGKLTNKRYNIMPYASPNVWVNLDDAVNQRGEPAFLRYIDFIKMQCTTEVYLRDETTPVEGLQESVVYIRDEHLLP